jgi:hypothetical protein
MRSKNLSYAWISIFFYEHLLNLLLLFSFLHQFVFLLLCQFLPCLHNLQECLINETTCLKFESLLDKSHTGCLFCFACTCWALSSFWHIIASYKDMVFCHLITIRRVDISNLNH